MNWIYLTVLILHFICSVLIFLGIQLHILRVRPYMFAVAALLPVWGPIIILVLHFRIAFDEGDSVELSVERMQLDNELFKSLKVDEVGSGKTTVPIEEALVVNNAMERRSIIMGVLNENPKEYVEFLQKAGNNEDTEVVHYAVTAMVELSKETDRTLQELETQYRETPDDYYVLERYANFIWECLEQDLFQGQVELMNRNLFSSLIAKKAETLPVIEDFVRLVDNELKLDNYESAERAVSFMGEKWHDTQEYYLSRFKYLVATRKGDEIKQLLAEIDKSEIYFSAKTKEMFAFWRI